MELTKEIIRELSKLPTGNVADNNPHGGVMDCGIRAVNPGLHMIGRAFPVECFPGDNLALHNGLYQAKAGDVLVYDCKGYTKGGHFGDMMASAAKEKGIAGVIIDGSCRDSQDILALDYPVYARAYCPAPTTKLHKGKVNVPVTAGGVTVRPGDLIFADNDGIVVIPFEEEDEVMKKALAKYDREQHLLEEIHAGKDPLDLFGFREKLAE